MVRFFFVSLPLWGRGTAIAVDEEKVGVRFVSIFFLKISYPVLLIRHSLRRATFPKGEGYFCLILALLGFRLRSG